MPYFADNLAVLFKAWTFFSVFYFFYFFFFSLDFFSSFFVYQVHPQSNLLMSFFNKIIDRAKHGNNKAEDTAKQQPSDQLAKDSNRSLFGIHTPHSSTSSANNNNQIIDQPQQQLPKVQEETPSNHYANGYVTPRQSQDLHQNMDVDTPGEYAHMINVL